MNHNSHSPETLTEMVSQIRSDITELKSDMKSGFDSIHRRQDVTNGKVIKHEDYINGHITMLSTLKTVGKLLGALFGIIVATVTALFSGFFNHL